MNIPQDPPPYVSCEEPAGSDTVDRLSGLFACALPPLRHSLRKILAAAETLRTTQLGPPFAALPGSIYDEGRLLLDGLNAVIDLAKLETGAVSMLHVAFDLELAATDVFEALAPIADAKSLEFVMNVAPELPRRAVGDPDRFRQVLHDICESSIQNTQSGYVSLDLDLAGATAETFRVRGTVRDSGKGSAAQRRCASLTACVRGGCDVMLAELKLALARSLILRMAGTIETEIDPAGRTVVFDFPVGRDPSIWPAPPPLSDIAGMTALAVGLSARMCGALRGQLNAFGLKLLEADSCTSGAFSISEESTRPNVLFVNATNQSAWEDFGRWVQRKWADDPPLCVAISPRVLAPLRHQLDEAHYADLLHGAFTPRKIRAAMLRISHCSQVINRQDRPAESVATPNCARVLAILADAPKRDALISLIKSCSDAEFPFSDAEISGAIAFAAYDVVVLDLDRTGSLTFAQAIRARRPEKPIPIVGLIGDPDHLSRAGAVAAGVTLLADKLLPEAELRGLLAQWFDCAGFHPAYDHAETLRRCGGDEEMLASLSMEMRRQLQPTLEKLRGSIGRQEVSEAVGAIRQLTEAAGFFGASDLSNAAGTLEILLKNRDWAGTHTPIAAVRIHICRLLEQLPEKVEAMR